MGSNPWYDIKSVDYDAHMSHPNVCQTQMLNKIIKEQFELLSINMRENASVAILGVTNGNGVEHAVSCQIGHIIGIDINQNFLNECKTRFDNSEINLSLYQIDLMNEITKAANVLSQCDLIIANLLIEHIHLGNFSNIIEKLPAHGQFISCVIQVNPDGSIASSSGVEHVFDAVVEQVEEENEKGITESMKRNNYSLIDKIIYNLPNGKQFIRLDYISLSLS